MDCSRARTKDPVEWMESCPEFSSRLAAQVREWILTWEPDLTESIKWNMLCFSGRKLICGLSACKHHLGIAFFRGTELPDPAALFNEGGEGNTHIRSVRLTTLDAFPRESLRRLLHAAAVLDANPEIPPVPKVRRKPWPVPDFFQRALDSRKHRAAAANFQRLAPTCQREYLVWLSTAKRPETRERRLQETLAALSQGMKWVNRRSATKSGSADSRRR